MTHDDSAGAGFFFEKSDHDGPAANFRKSNFLTRKDDAVPLLSHDVRPNMPTSLVSVKIDQPAKSKKAKKLWGSSDQIFRLLRLLIDKFIDPQAVGKVSGIPFCL